MNISEIDKQAIALMQIDKPEEASLLYKKPLIVLHNNLANLLILQGHYEEALKHYEISLSLTSTPLPWQYVNIAKTCRSLLRFDEAIHYFTKAPDAYNEIGVTYHLKGDFDNALLYFQKAIALNPLDASAHYNKTSTLLLLGDWKNAGSGLDWRFSPHFYHRTQTPSPEIPLWKGEQISGKKMLLFCECGYGDVLQFIRYVPFLKDAEHLFFLCPKPLVPLLKENINMPNLSFIDQAVPCDFRVSILSLPFLLNTPPTSRPYLNVKSTVVPGEKMRVGLCWTREGKSPPETNRAVPVELFQEFLDISSIQYYSLQVNAEADFEKLNHQNQVINLGATFNHFLDTARAIAQLDLVITIDTAVAHLAGALGKSTWVLLPFIPDWRWGLNQQDTPWYSQVTLFRQCENRKWPVKKVKEKLVDMNTKRQ